MNLKINKNGFELSLKKNQNGTENKQYKIQIISQLQPNEYKPIISSEDEQYVQLDTDQSGKKSIKIEWVGP